MPADYRVRVTTANKLEGLLFNELDQLGLAEPRQTRGAVEGLATRATIYRILLGSRLAARVLLPLTDAPAGNADALYAALRAFAWEDHITFPASLAVDCHGRSTAIRHTRFGSQRIKDAIADRARALGTSVTVDTRHPDIRLSALLRDETAYLALDLSGGSLHRRGYREATVEAPLKEPLAAAILMRAGWPERAATARVLFDPCCGAGTLLAEGAMMAAGMAPGLLRESFGLSGWRNHDAQAWRDCRQAHREAVVSDADAMPAIVGYDRDPDAIRATRANLARLGLACHSDLRVADIDDDKPSWPAGPGVMVTNPPYGQRLGGRRQAEDLYQRLGGRARNELPGWHLAVVSDRSSHLAALGLSSRRVYRLLNGQLDCRIGTYDIHAFGPAKTQARPWPAPAELYNRIIKNERHLAKWRKRAGIGAYRIYDGDIPEYPFAIDVYCGEAGTQVRVMEYEPANHVTARQAAQRRRAVLGSAAEALELARDRIQLIGTDGTSRPESSGELGSEDGRCVVREGSARLAVMTVSGPHLDPCLTRRGLRQRLHDEAYGLSLLNLFHQDSAATIQGAVGGASATTSVTADQAGGRRLRQNLALNQLDNDPRHEIITVEAPLAWLEGAREDARCWDQILVELSGSLLPASGANPLNDEAPRLIRAAAAVTRSGGRIYVVGDDGRFAPEQAGLTDLSPSEITAAIRQRDLQRGPMAYRCWLLQAIDGQG